MRQPKSVYTHKQLWHVDLDVGEGISDVHTQYCVQAYSRAEAVRKAREFAYQDGFKVERVKSTSLI